MNKERTPRKDKGLPRDKNKRAVELLFRIYADLVRCIMFNEEPHTKDYMQKIQTTLTDLDPTRINKIMADALQAKTHSPAATPPLRTAEQSMIRR